MDGTVHDPGMEGRVERLEQDMNEVKATLGRLEPMIVSIHAQMPHLATKAEVEALHGEVKNDMATLRGELKNDMANLRGELKSDMANLRGELKSDMAHLRGELKNDMANLRGELKNDIETLRGQTLAALAKKPGVAAMWSMGLSLFTLVVAAMAAGAAYLPLLSNSLHASH